jgi:hypothetical protein
MFPRLALYRTAVSLLLGCSLQGEPTPRTFVIDNRSPFHWILLNPVAPSSGPGLEIQTQGGAPWPDSSPPEGFSGIILAHASLTFTVCGEAGPPSASLHLRRLDGLQVQPLQLDLDLAAASPGSGKDLEPPSRFILTATEELLPFPGSPCPSPPVQGASSAESMEIPIQTVAPKPENEGPGIYPSQDLKSRLAQEFQEPVLEALAAPLNQMQDLHTACGKHLASQQALATEFNTLDPATGARRMGVIRSLMEQEETRARKAFIDQGERTLPQAQAHVLKALNALHRRLLRRPPLPAGTTVEALASAYQLLAAQRVLLQYLAFEWDSIALRAPWAGWREGLKLPRPDGLTDLLLGWERLPGEKRPSFIVETGDAQRQFARGAERELDLARKLGIDLQALNRFNVVAWAAAAEEARIAEAARLKVRQEKEAAESASRERDKTERAEAHRKRETERLALKKSKEKCEQEAKREAAARAKEQQKLDRQLRAEEKRRNLEEAGIKRQLEDRRRQEAALQADAARKAEAARRAEAARQTAEARQRAQDLRTAEAQRKRAAQAQAEAERAAAEAAALADQARIRAERDRRIQDLLFIPRGAPLGRHMANRVQATLERRGLALPPREAPPEWEPPGPPLVNPLQRFRSGSLLTLRLFSPFTADVWGACPERTGPARAE